jgi:hypothetical protein
MKGPAAVDGPCERRTPIGQRHISRGFVRVAAMRQKQFQCGVVLKVDRAIDRIAFCDACAVLQQQAGTGRAFEGVVERLAVIGICAGVEQQPRQ